MREIGVARAAYFPQLSLSGLLGGQSTQLASLFSGPAQRMEPGAAGSRSRSSPPGASNRMSNWPRRSAITRLCNMRRPSRPRLRKCRTRLIAHQRVAGKPCSKQEALVPALQDRLRLAYVRYRGGVDTQLNALDADRDLFQAQFDLSQIRLDEILTVVQLYKALGGGWQA